MAEERAQDNAWARAALLARGPRPVMHAALGEARTELKALRDELGADHRSARHEFDALEEIPADQLERAVDVVHGKPEHAPHQPVPCGRVHASSQRVLARDPVPDDQIGGRREGQEVLHLVEVELEVGVGEEHPRHPGGVDAGAHGGSVPAVVRMDDEADAAVVGGESPGHERRLVAASVVDHDHLVSPAESQRGIGRLTHGAPDVRLFVEAGQHDRETGEHPGDADSSSGKRFGKRLR